MFSNDINMVIMLMMRVVATRKMIQQGSLFDGNEFHLSGLMMMAVMVMVLVLMMVTAIMRMMKMMMLLLTSPGTVRLPPVPQGNG